MRLAIKDKYFVNSLKDVVEDKYKKYHSAWEATMKLIDDNMCYRQERIQNFNSKILVKFET